MMRTGNRTAFPATANDSRRSGRRSSGRSGWRRSLGRTRRAIDSSLRLIDASTRAIDVAEQSAATCPIRANRRFQRVSFWLVDAGKHLQRAAHGLRDTANQVARAPEDAAEAPGRLIDATARWLDSAAQIGAVSGRLDEASVRLVDSVKAGDVSIALYELARNVPAWTALLKTSGICGGRDRAVSIRRPCQHHNQFTEAIRRTVRGRAPPFLSTCPL